MESNRLIFKVRSGIACLVVLFLFEGCVSIKAYNERIERPIKEEKLKADVDFLQTKLNRLQPNLDWYISKAALQHQFDSLKKTIDRPLTSNEFYFKISPVMASIRQGHAHVFQQHPRLTSEQRRLAQKRGWTPLSKLEFETTDTAVYVVQHDDEQSEIMLGSQLLSVNQVTPHELLSKYRPTFTSDGFNQTFIQNRLSHEISGYYLDEFGLQDSVYCTFKYQDTTQSLWLKFPAQSHEESINANSKTASKERKEAQKAENKKRKLQGYDAQAKTYCKSLTFAELDNSVAVLKINDFAHGRFREYYSQCFKKLDSLGTQNLIIDLRDNPGGRLEDARSLYAFLADSAFQFIDPPEVASRFSLFHRYFFREIPLYYNVLVLTAYPGMIIRDVISFFSIKKDDQGKYVYPIPQSRIAQPEAAKFAGKVYVLINGGSFSASSLLSSDLKGSQRATFVGEETGGAYNGCTAGKMPLYTLPKSKLPVIFGLLTIRPYYKSDLEGRGIFPDVGIRPTLEDRIKQRDPEMQWVLDDIKGLHTALPEQR